MKLAEKDIEKFLSDRAYAEATQKGHRYTLRAFIKWLGDRDLSEDTVREYARERYEKPSSRNAFLAIMKTFADRKMKRLPHEDQGAYIRNRQVLERIGNIRLERVVMRLERKVFSMDELKKIFSALEGAEFSGLWCLGWFGCRLGELVALALSNINKEPDRYLPPSLAKELGPDEYCVKFLTKKTVVERALFMDRFTKQHLKNFIESGHGCKFLQTACAKLQGKVGVGFTPKWFRSTFLTEMQRALMRADEYPLMGKVNRLVKVMSGHIVHSRDIMGIDTVSGEDIKLAMTRLHFMKPLEEEKRSSLDEPDNRAIPEQMGGSIEKWGRVKK